MTTTFAALVTTSEGRSWLFACSLETSSFLVASWVGATLLRRGSAAARHQMWTLGVIGALVLPLLCWTVPSVLRAASDPPALSTIAHTASAVGLSASASSVTAANVSPSAWPIWLALVWAVGAIVVTARCLRGHLAAHRLVTAATADIPETWVAIVRETAGLLEVAPSSITLRCSEAIESPMTIGVMRARVLLPVAARSWSRERLRAALVHEIGHVRRQDVRVHLLAQIACAVYWWNPLAWLAAARLRIEREHACDDHVLDAGILPSSYATDLLDVARAVSTKSSRHAVAMCMLDGSATEVRLRRILDTATPRQRVGQSFRIATCGLAVACAAVFACTSSPPAVAAPSDDRGAVTMGIVGLRELDQTDLLAVAREQPAGLARDGSVDLSLVAAAVTSRLGTLETCYRRRLAERPALAGTVVIHWVIDQAGGTPEACITEDTVHDRELTSCVNRLVLEGGFPAASNGTVDVEVPFVFAARSPVATR